MATLRVPPETVAGALETVSLVCRRYQIATLDDFVESCRAFSRDELLNVAVLGRFKAGKSSFLNCVIGRPLLPVGAIPVTAVVTEIEYGPRDRAEVTFEDGSVERISPEQTAEYVSEAQNPENVKRVVRVRLELTSMSQYRGIRFVDTPGLESVLEHNTDASLEWLPNVGLALVAVGVDPPLSQHDVELIRKLDRYTPNVSLLLTKADLLDEGDRAQVEDFVRKQLARYWDHPVSVFPFSTRPGFENLRARIDQELLSGARSGASDHHAAILRHKIDSLLEECAEYLSLALKAAERDESEREQLRQSILGQQESIDDTRQALRLMARHGMATSRAAFEKILYEEEKPVREKLLAALGGKFPAWTASLAEAARRFEEWLGGEVTKEMSTLSERHRTEFVEPIRRVGRQLTQSLQDFRNRLSERALIALGVPLRTSELELPIHEPTAPDTRVGRIFDRDWALISFLLPMWAIKGLVKRHFRRMVADVVFMNLSRLATQWEEAVGGSISTLEKEALRRLDGLVATIEKLIASAERETPQIRADLSSLEELRSALERTDS